jgi:hypothetical protein
VLSWIGFTMLRPRRPRRPPRPIRHALQTEKSHQLLLWGRQLFEVWSILLERLVSEAEQSAMKMDILRGPGRILLTAACLRP